MYTDQCSQPKSIRLKSIVIYSVLKLTGERKDGSEQIQNKKWWDS